MMHTDKRLDGEKISIFCQEWFGFKKGEVSCTFDHEPMLSETEGCAAKLVPGMNVYLEDDSRLCIYEVSLYNDNMIQIKSIDPSRDYLHTVVSQFEIDAVFDNYNERMKIESFLVDAVQGELDGGSHSYSHKNVYHHVIPMIKDSGESFSLIASPEKEGGYYIGFLDKEGISYLYVDLPTSFLNCHAS